MGSLYYFYLGFCILLFLGISYPTSTWDLLSYLTTWEWGRIRWEMTDLHCKRSNEHMRFQTWNCVHSKGRILFCLKASKWPKLMKNEFLFPTSSNFTSPIKIYIIFIFKMVFLNLIHPDWVKNPLSVGFLCPSLKATGTEISSGPSSKEGYARFKTIPLKPLSNQ